MEGEKPPLYDLARYASNSSSTTLLSLSVSHDNLIIAVRKNNRHATVMSSTRLRCWRLNGIQLYNAAVEKRRECTLQTGVELTIVVIRPPSVRHQLTVVSRMSECLNSLCRRLSQLRLLLLRSARCYTARAGPCGTLDDG